MAGIGWWLRSKRRLPRQAVVLVGLLLPVFLWMGAARAGPPSALTVTFFDVGQGDSALVRSPGGATILIDGGPDLDFVSLAQGMGVPATRATTAEEFAAQLRQAFAEPGPHLIDAVVPPVG